MTAPTDLAELDRLIAAATPGEWFVGPAYKDDSGQRELPITTRVGEREFYPAACFLQFPNSPGMQEANAALIVWIHNNAPALLAQVRAQEAEVEAMRKVIAAADLMRAGLCTHDGVSVVYAYDAARAALGEKP